MVKSATTVPHHAEPPDAAGAAQRGIAADRFGQFVLAAALFFSGVAALVNQAVWQRSLNIYLAG